MIGRGCSELSFQNSWRSDLISVFFCFSFFFFVLIYIHFFVYFLINLFTQLSILSIYLRVVNYFYLIICLLIYLRTSVEGVEWRIEDSRTSFKQSRERHDHCIPRFESWDRTRRETKTGQKWCLLDVRCNYSGNGIISIASIYWSIKFVRDIFHFILFLIFSLCSCWDSVSLYNLIS